MQQTDYHDTVTTGIPRLVKGRDMCAVSVIHDYMRMNTAPQDWTRPAFNEFHEVIRRLDLLDQKLGQRDCHDPEKATWMEEVERRLQKLET